MKQIIRFLIIIASLLANTSFAETLDSITLKDNSKFLDENFDIINTKFSSSILKSIHGTYVSTLIFDSTNSEKDTSFILKITDSIIETKSLIDNTTKSEKTAFFVTGNHKVSNAEFFVTYTTKNVFFFLTKTIGSYKDFGDYSLLILFQDNNGPQSMNFILRKSK